MKNLFYRKICLCIIFLSLFSIHLHSQNGWTNITTLPTGRGASLASVIGEKIYVIGGAAEFTYADMNNNEVYNTLTNTWDTLAPMPTPRGYLMGAVVNDTIYAIGGGYPTYKNKVEAYNPITNSWIPKPDMPTSRTGMNAAAVDGIIYIIGGTYNQRICQAYDPSTGTWTTKTPMPEGGGALSVTVYNGLVYTFGGSTYTPWAGLSTVYAYNPPTDTWTKKKDMPTPRFALQTYLVNGKIYAIGGSQSQGTALSTVEEYDPATDTWKTLSQMPQSLAWFAGAVVNNKIYVISGTSDWATGDGAVWEYDPTQDPLLPVELVSFTGNIVDGTVLLKWSTSTEINNKGFEIYRNGKKISFIDGNGTTTEKHDYTFYDAGLNGGLYNYRLNQIDFDGTQKVVGEITINLIIPAEFSLEQNYPNPFNPSTNIKYGVSNQEFVSLKIYDALGNEVAALVNEEKPAGTYEVTWNAEGLSSGVYFYQLKAGDFTATKKLLLLK